MNIRERLLGLHREAEQKTAEEQRQREATEARQRAEELRQENLKKVRFERGKKILESKGIPAVMGEVLEVLKPLNLGVELDIREGKCLVNNNRWVETVGVFVGNYEGLQTYEGRTNVQIGVQLDSHNLASLYVKAVKTTFANAGEKDTFSINDKNLTPKIEKRLAELIFEREHEHYDSIYREPSW